MVSSNHKRKLKVPALHAGVGHVAEVASSSADNRRIRACRGVMDTMAKESSTPVPTAYVGEDWDTSAARQADDFSYELGNTGLEPEPDEGGEDGIVLVVQERSRNSDRPWLTYIKGDYRQESLDEEMCQQGRGDEKVYSRCAGVKCVDPLRECPNRECGRVPEYRCSDAVCHGEAMRCAECIVASHQSHPTHFLEKWDGTHWVKKRTLLRDLGLRTQLGHPAGVICPFKKAAAADFVLYDLSGVHELGVDFCGCPGAEEHRVQLRRVCWWPATVYSPNTCTTYAALRFFHLINCSGKLSAYDFIRGLEMCTNHDGLDPPPDRRKPFMHIMRRWRDTKQLKRAGCGHVEDGVANVVQGQLRLDCCACPQPGWNLDEDWEKVPDFYKYIYFLFLAQDANFRLSNQNVSSEAVDPILSDGCGYFCNQVEYKAHIIKHVDEEEMSSCSGFQAMFLANVKRVKGLKTTGIAGVTCSRHNGWISLGNLQWGERQCNHAPEYILHENLWWKVPNFHLPLHKWFCHLPYSFHFMWGTGLEREVPEQVKEWRGWITRWESKQHTDSVESPYEVKIEAGKQMTLRDIQLQIAQEEFILTDDRVEVEREDTPSTFLAMGMGIESEQCKLAIDVKALKDPSPATKIKHVKWRTLLLKHIQKFRALQLVYMPGAQGWLTDAQKQVFDGNGEQLPEATRLFMPSEFSDTTTRGRVCASGLGELEAHMREGEALESLEAVRHGLRSQTMTNRFNIRNYTGQGALRRGQNVLREINIKIHLAKVQYRYARSALLVLRGHGTWEERLQVLHDDDVRALNERALTEAEKANVELWAQLGAVIEGGVAVAAVVAAGEGSQTLSWIWMMIGVTEDGPSGKLDDALRVEWCKTAAHATRYSEEVCTISAEVPGSSVELMEGHRVHAAERADIERRTCKMLTKKWQKIRAKADEYLAKDRHVYLSGVVQVKIDEELDTEEEEAHLELEEA
ncbi:hypothetical protein C8J57DRAFT_1536840 [Mycena rebaudengoi]|nr:hypothetical protein C8J57DRAFT_1536840 [Mycena rebaudengoi]